MKRASDFLWQLIHSLSSNEKRYFHRNFIHLPEKETIYLDLFSAIAAQKSYDEEHVLKKFHPRLNRKNIAAQKHYLQRLIGEAIVDYDGKNNPAHDIYHQVRLIGIFRKKGLLQEA